MSKLNKNQLEKINNKVIKFTVKWVYKGNNCKTYGEIMKYRYRMIAGIY